jgi:hypothetical protein
MKKVMKTSILIRRENPKVLFFLAGAVAIVNTALGLPAAATDTANSCSVCHGLPIAEQPIGLPTFQFLSGQIDGAKVEGRMSVTQTGPLLDLGTQLNGKTRGPLKVFRVISGGTATLQVDVLNGSNDYAVQLKRLETEGQVNSQENFLIWSEANEVGNDWDMWGESSPYFTAGGFSDTDPTTLSFDLLIDADTPADVYDLEFALPGHDPGSPENLFYQDEHFYLDVLPAANVRGWLFWDSFPWVYSDDAADWLYLVSEDGFLWAFSWNDQTWGAMQTD